MVRRGALLMRATCHLHLQKPIIVNKECQTLAGRGALFLIFNERRPTGKNHLAGTCEILGVVARPNPSRLRHLTWPSASARSTSDPPIVSPWVKYTSRRSESMVVPSVTMRTLPLYFAL